MKKKKEPKQPKPKRGRRLSKKGIIAGVSSIVLLCGIGGGVYWYLNQEEPPPPPEPIVDKQISVADIKAKYGYTDNTISPLYNVSSSEQFGIGFNSYLGNMPQGDIVTVHSHRSLSVSSTIGIELVPESFDVGPSKFTIKPTERLLGGADGTWGIGHMYYIAINYDLDANTPTRLDKPIVIPFTVKGKSENIELVASVESNGEYNLNFTTPSSKTNVALTNIVNGNSVKIESEGYDVEDGKFLNTYNTILTKSMVKGYNDWLMDNPKKGKLVPQSSGELNKGLNGSYFIRGVVGDKHSVASNIVNVSELAYKVPKKLATPIETSHSTIRSMQKLVGVEMLNGVTVASAVRYHTDDVKVVAGKPTEIPYTVDGTSYKGVVEVANMSEGDLEILSLGNKVNLVASHNKPINNTKQKPSIELPTIISDFVVAEETVEGAVSNAEGSPQGVDASKGTQEVVQPEAQGAETQPKQGAQSATSGGLALGTGVVDPTQPSEEVDPTEGMGLINKQYYHNGVQLEQANTATVTVPAYIQESGYNLSHDNAVEEYIAYEMLGGKTDISLKAFPDVQNYHTVSDAMEKVMAQNSLLNNVQEWWYDYEKQSVSIVYNTNFAPSELLSLAGAVVDQLAYKAEELTKKQIEKGISPKRVSKGYTERELYDVYYNYLVENIKQPMVEEYLASLQPEPVVEGAEVEKAEDIVDAKEVATEEVKPEDSLPQAPETTAYSALSNGVANDTGIAKALKLLLEISGVPSIVVTGEFDNTPHVWNKVSLEDKWYNTDVSQSLVASGVMNYLNLTSDATAKMLGYRPDGSYVTDTFKESFVSETGMLDHYIANDLEVESVERFTSVLERELGGDDRVITLRTSVLLPIKDLYDLTGWVVQMVKPDYLATATLQQKGYYYVITLYEEEAVEEVVEELPQEGVTDSTESGQEDVGKQLQNDVEQQDINQDSVPEATKSSE